MAKLAGFPFIFVAVSILILSSLVLAQRGEDISSDVAVKTDFQQPLAVTSYDIALRTELNKNRLVLRTLCSLRNSSPQELDLVDFDLFAREKFYGVKVEIAEVTRSVGGRDIPVEFTHAALVKPSDPAQEGSEKSPKILRLRLSPALKAGEEGRLAFAYAITPLDPKDENLPYRIFALLPDGTMEICLITDFTWLPRVSSDYEKMMDLSSRNFFTRQPKPAWKITLTHSSAYESLVVDGRREKAEQAGPETISRYVSVVGGYPQLLIGKTERVEVKGHGRSVVFLLPRGQYELPLVQAMGNFLLRAYEFYSELAGPLGEKDISIAASSADMGGHGAFLGSFLDARAFQRKMSPAELAPDKFFDSTAAHELAHSWWGESVSSYGRGTKFLREAFSNFFTWRFAAEAYGREEFRENMAVLFFQKTAKLPLFLPARDNQRLAYNKGALVLDILRGEMGDEIFFKVLKAFAARFRDGHATFVDFVSVCNELSERDWMPFFMHWCYEEGYPVYRLTALDSTAGQSGWETKVTIRNDGQGTIRCPLELRMAEGSQEVLFWVPAGEERTFAYRTSGRVKEALIDPRHEAFQGDENEGEKKIMSLRCPSRWEWVNYWKGVAYGKAGQYEEALRWLSLAVAAHEEAFGKGRASYGFYFSRGIVYLRLGEREKANQDIRSFFGNLLAAAKRGLEDLTSRVAYAGLISGTQKEQEAQLQKILYLLGGEDIPLDKTLEKWATWWNAHEKDFVISPLASGLGPGGLE